MLVIIYKRHQADCKFRAGDKQDKRRLAPLPLLGVAGNQHQRQARAQEPENIIVGSRQAKGPRARATASGRGARQRTRSG